MPTWLFMSSPHVCSSGIGDKCFPTLPTLRPPKVSLIGQQTRERLTLFSGSGFQCEQHYSKLARCFSTAVILCDSWAVKKGSCGVVWPSVALLSCLRSAKNRGIANFEIVSNLLLSKSIHSYRSLFRSSWKYVAEVCFTTHKRLKNNV